MRRELPRASIEIKPCVKRSFNYKRLKTIKILKVVNATSKWSRSLREVVVLKRSKCMSLSGKLLGFWIAGGL